MDPGDDLQNLHAILQPFTPYSSIHPRPLEADELWLGQGLVIQNPVIEVFP